MAGSERLGAIREGGSGQWHPARHIAAATKASAAVTAAAASNVLHRSAIPLCSSSGLGSNVMESETKWCGEQARRWFPLLHAQRAHNNRVKIMSAFAGFELLADPFPCWKGLKKLNSCARNAAIPSSKAIDRIPRFSPSRKSSAYVSGSVSLFSSEDATLPANRCFWHFFEKNQLDLAPGRFAFVLFAVGYITTDVLLFMDMGALRWMGIRGR